tara:strand:- start:151 stop:441 length:291 start_codon:yes stop_codon:yes gene_type:complete
LILTGSQKRYLRGLAHHRTIAVTIGSAGLSDAVVDELEQALAHHELVKMKLPAAPKHKKKELLHLACDYTGSVAIQLIGRIGIAYRKASKPVIELP